MGREIAFPKCCDKPHVSFLDYNHKARCETCGFEARWNYQAEAWIPIRPERLSEGAPKGRCDSLNPGNNARNETGEPTTSADTFSEATRKGAKGRS